MPFPRLRPAFVLVCLLLHPAGAWAAASPVVGLGPDGTLQYRGDERGNTLPDFSRAGYGGGGKALPHLPVVERLGPQASGDDTDRLQAALDRLAARAPDARGWRGALELDRGEYRIAGTLHLRAGGVVLRGAGSGEDGTVLRGTGTRQRTLIEVGAEGARRRELPGTRRAITDAYVPWSGRSFRVSSAEGLRPGDRIMVFRPSTAEWIHALGMDRIKPRQGAGDSTQQWKPGGFNLELERTIVAIDGDRLTLDAPVMNALDAAFGGGEIYRFTHPRLLDCGVEQLRLVSDYQRGQETSDERHAWLGVKLGAVENAWVSDVTVVHFSHAVEAAGSAIFTTIRDCVHLDPVSLVTGGRRYSFSLNGQYGLVLRCRARGARHTFVTGSRVCGPNVFLDGVAEHALADSGPHHRWAVGSLYDNIADDNQLRVQDRQWAGSGHGWAGAQQVLWNCRSRTFVVQQPPTGQNYAIGCVGRFVAGEWNPRAAPGLIESVGAPVAPRSLYLAQLEARLGAAAVAAALAPSAGVTP